MPSSSSSSDSSSRSRSPKRNKKRVYVTGYSLKEDQHDVKKLFKKYGKIEEFAWKGKYCFIEFKSPDDAEKAVKKLNREEFNGSTLQVEMAKGNKPSRNNGVCYSCGKKGHLQVQNFITQNNFIFFFNQFSAKNCRYRRSSSSSSDSSSRYGFAILVSQKRNIRRRAKRREVHQVRA